MAKFGYNQRENDELSFEKGEELEVMEESHEWSMKKSLVTGHEGWLVPSEYFTPNEHLTLVLL